MALGHYRTPFKKALLLFITGLDPSPAMLKRVMTEIRAGAYRCRSGRPSSTGSPTRKIERLAQAMVSELNKELDAQVADFRTRPVAEE